MNSIIYENNNFKVMDLSIEYNGYIGDAKYAIITDLSEKELNSEHANEIKEYVPFVILTSEMYEAMTDSYKKDDRERKREALYHDSFAFDEGIELADESADVFFLSDSSYNMQRILDKMMSLPGRQGPRMYKRYFLHMTSAEIARSEGVDSSSVRESIIRGKANMHDIFVELGVIS